MNRKIIPLLFVFLLCFSLVVAIDFTPQGNQNMRNYYNISNVPYYNGTDINLTGHYYGNGSELTDINATFWDGEDSQGDLNVNSSEYWDNLNSINATQMENSGGYLNILESWLTTFFNTLFSGKDTDDLTEGSTNLYDNQSWNQSHANSLYHIEGNELTDVLNWTKLKNYPVACPSDSYVTQIDDTITCTELSDVYLLNSGDTGDGAYVFKGGAFTINEDGEDYDTKIEGDNDANLFYVDAGDDKIGLSTSSPEELLDVRGNIGLSGRLVGTDYNGGIDSGRIITPWDSSGENSYAGWGAVNEMTMRINDSISYRGNYSLRSTRTGSTGAGGNSWNFGDLKPGNYSFSGYFYCNSSFNDFTILLRDAGTQPYSGGTTYSEKYDCNDSWERFSQSMIVTDNANSEFLWLASGLSDGEYIFFDELSFSEGTLSKQSYLPFVADGYGDVYMEYGNLGIGTNTPGTILDVMGATTLQNGTCTIKGAGAGLIIGRRDTGANTYQWYSDSGNLQLYDYGNSVDFMVLQSSEIAFNEGSKDINFRVEGNGNANLLYCDAGEDNVGIGKNSPGEKLEVDGNINVTSGNDVCITGGECLSDLTTGTSYYSIHPTDCIGGAPNENNLDYGVNTVKANGEYAIYCPVHLPHGATVTGAIGYGPYTDDWALRNTDVTSTTGSPAGSGTMATAANNTADTSISFATIDNSQYAYSMTVVSLENDEYFFGGVVTYTT